MSKLLFEALGMTKEKAISELEGVIASDEDIDFFTVDEKLAMEFAVSALSEDVRPNIHARWESDGHGHIICSACKEANVSTWKSRFCPMCGARMDAEVEPNKKGDK